MSDVARVSRYHDGGFSVLTWCPGCDGLHPFRVEAPPSMADAPTWDWDGDLERPTFSPSLLVHHSVHLCAAEHPPEPCPDPDSCPESGHQVLRESEWGVPQELGHPTPHTRDPAFGPCHSFLRAGEWEFLDDCAHALRGRHPMVPLPPLWGER